MGLGQILSGTNTIQPVLEPRDQINGVIDGMSNTSGTTNNWANGTGSNLTAAAGQVLVKINGNNPTPPQIMIYGIADTSMEILI